MDIVLLLMGWGELKYEVLNNNLIKRDNICRSLKFESMIRLKTKIKSIKVTNHPKPFDLGGLEK